MHWPIRSQFFTCLQVPPWGKAGPYKIKIKMRQPIKSCFLSSCSNQIYCKWRFKNIIQRKLSIRPSLREAVQLSVTFEKIPLADRPRQNFPDFTTNFLYLPSLPTCLYECCMTDSVVNLYECCRTDSVVEKLYECYMTDSVVETLYE